MRGTYNKYYTDEIHKNHPHIKSSTDQLNHLRFTCSNIQLAYTLANIYKKHYHLVNISHAINYFDCLDAKATILCAAKPQIK